MSRKKKYSPKPFESTGRLNDTSANIYESMLISEAFAFLTDRQKMLYVCCKAQYYGKRKPERDYPDVEQLQGEELFYLNWAAVQRYGMYKPSMHSNFYRDMKALCDVGFIEKVASGARQRRKSIYRFSDRWQAWKLGRE